MEFILLVGSISSPRVADSAVASSAGGGDVEAVLTGELGCCGALAVAASPSGATGATAPPATAAAAAAAAGVGLKGRTVLRGRRL